MINLYKGKEAKLNRLASLKNPYERRTFASLFLSAVYFAFLPAAAARSFLYAEVGFLLEISSVKIT